MQEYTESADHIRRDIEHLKNRSARVVTNAKCDLTAKPVLHQPFLLFPCNHVFLQEAVIDKVDEYNRRRGVGRLNRNRGQAWIIDKCSEECPLCGKIMIEEVLTPFIAETDQDRMELQSWAIGRD